MTPAEHRLIVRQRAEARASALSRQLDDLLSALNKAPPAEREAFLISARDEMQALVEEIMDAQQDLFKLMTPWERFTAKVTFHTALAAGFVMSFLGGLSVVQFFRHQLLSLMLWFRRGQL